MDVDRWILMFVVESIFLWWVVYGGGAARLEGWRSYFLINALAPRWSADGIRLYCFFSWWISLVWFVIGLIWPELRIRF